MTTASTFKVDPETVHPDDVAVVSPPDDGVRAIPQPEVMAALRYLIYRHELSTGVAQIPQMIAVVGASRGEGVTTVSRSLAEVLALERRSEVCWVDLGQPDLDGPSEERGRTEISRVGDSSETPRPPESNLRAPLVPAWPHTNGVGEVVRPGPFWDRDLDDWVDDLARRYRHVVFDTPPLLSQADSIGFLRRADAYILVVRQGATSLKQVQRMSEELRSLPSLGAVLNRYRTRTPSSLRRLIAE